MPGRDETFRGADRRARPAERESIREHALSGVLLLVVASFALRAPVSPPVGAVTLEAALAACAVMLAGLAGAASIMGWQLTGNAISLRVGVALVVLGVGEPLLGQLLPLADPSMRHNVWARSISEAMVAAAIALFALALTHPEVDARLRPGRVFGGVAAVAMVLTLLFAAVFDAIGTSPLRIFEVVALTALGIGYWVRGVRCRRALLTWLALMFFGLALAWLVDLSARSIHDTRVEVFGLLVVLAATFALIGIGRELARAYVVQRTFRFDAELNAELANARFRTERAAREEQLHDTRSAVAAIQGATSVLEHQVDRLSSAERASLTGAIDAELARVRDILSVDAASVLPEAFRVYDVLLPLVTCQRASGRAIVAEIPRSIVAVARPATVVEVIQNLVDNAARHASGSPITVRAMVVADCVHIRVEDDGPGVPVRVRRAIFERGVSTSGERGSGLGLFVARRLTRENGGDLWVEDAPRGGAAFVLCLPAQGAPPSRQCGGRAEHLEQASDRGHVGDVERHDLLERAGSQPSPRVHRDAELEHGARFGV